MSPRGQAKEISEQVKDDLQKTLMGVQKRKEHLLARRQQLQEQLQAVNSSLATIDADVASVLKETLQGLNITLPSGPRHPRARRTGGNRQWILDLLRQNGPLKTNSILEEAAKAGKNPKTILTILSVLSRDGEILSQKADRGRGRAYSLKQS